MSNLRHGRKNPKSTEKKRKLPNREQIEFFRLGHSTLTHVKDFQEQYLEFYKGLGSQYAQTMEEKDEIRRREYEMYKSESQNLYNDTFDLSSLPSHLQTDNLIMKPPHSLIHDCIQRSIQYYDEFIAKKEVESHRTVRIKEQKSDNSNDSSTVVSSVINPATSDMAAAASASAAMIANDSISMDNNADSVAETLSSMNIDNSQALMPPSKRRRINTNEVNPPSIATLSIAATDGTTVGTIVGNAYATSHIAVDASAAAAATAAMVDSEMKENSGTADVNANGSQSRDISSQRDDNGTMPIQTDRRHLLFAECVTLPPFKDLSNVFTNYHKYRKEFKDKPSRKEVNAISDLTIRYTLDKVERNKGFQSIDPTTVVLSVAIFQSNKSSERFSRAQELLILGHQTLADLKDAIYCITDKQMIADKIKNSFFFIEDTFYDDMRHSNAQRLSQQIVDWNRSDETNWSEVGVYTQQNMENTKMTDLSIRLGTHYLYIHSGDCDHICVFTDIRIIHRNDPQNAYAYPFTVYKKIARRQKCGVCDMYPAKFVTYGDKLTTQNPFFFCQRCYFPLHCNRPTPATDANNTSQLLYDDFTVFEYEHD